MTRFIDQRLTAAVVIAFVVAGCAAVPPAEQQAERAEAPAPPEVNVGSPAQQAQQAQQVARSREAQATEQGTASDSLAASEAANSKATGGPGWFPGLKERPAAVREGTAGSAPASDLPFEQSLSKRRKRIDLGLEPTRQAGQPVNNVLDLEF